MNFFLVSRVAHQEIKIICHAITFNYVVKSYKNCTTRKTCPPQPTKLWLGVLNDYITTVAL